jgi:photosystem II stability/assembly factor-like uncharacterized protein
MKKIIFASLLLIFSTSTAISQSGWFWQNPKPQGNSLSKVQFLSNDVVIAVGYNGTILKSTNSGINWYNTNTNTDKWINSVSFINNNTGFAGGEGLLKTTDSGENWNLHSSQNGKAFFLNNNTGFTIGSVPWPPPTYSAGFISRTTDGGHTWSQGIYPLAYSFNSLDIKGNLAMVCGSGYDGSIIFLTTNYGNNWIYKQTNTFGDLQSINFLSDSIIITSGYTSTYGVVLKTTNLGTNWLVISNSLPPYIYDSYFINQNTGYIVGVNGIILKTSNSGNNWHQNIMPFDSYFNGISFDNSGNGVICGSRGIIYLSSNSGENWYSPYNRIYEKNFNKLYFLNKDSGFVLGDSSWIFRTTNGGFNWTSTQISQNKIIRSINFANINIGYAVGLSGSIFKTTNSGVNWIDVGFNYNQNINDVFFINENTGYLTGFYSEVIKTTNGGLNWQQIPTGFTFSMISIKFLNIDTGFIAGTSNTILKTINGGLNWEMVNYQNGFNHLSEIHFENINTGYSAGSSGYIYKTTNNGSNWVQLATPTNRTFNSISFANPNYGIAVGDFGNIATTTNGGITWSLKTNVTGSELNGVCTFDSLNATIIGSDGIILRTSNGGNPIGVNPVSLEIPVYYYLHQNYPNPFNPITKIKFNIPQLSNAKIIIYDLLGREITTLVNEQLKPGIYEVDWNGSNYASGVYFYSLETDEYKETKRMVLIK